MSISHQANLIAEQLRIWAEPRNGTVKVMANMSHLWEELYVVREEPRLLVVFVSEAPVGSFNISSALSRVNRTWNVIIVRGHGFRNLMAETDGESEPFYDSVETIREELRVMLNISEEFPIDYQGIKPLPNIAQSAEKNAFMDAYQVSFITVNNIPEIQRQGDYPQEI